MADHAVLDGDLCGRNAPLRCRRIHEHGARTGSGRTKLCPGIVDRGRPTRSLHAHHRIGIDIGNGSGLFNLDI